MKKIFTLLLTFFCLNLFAQEAEDTVSLNPDKDYTEVWDSLFTAVY